MDDKWINSPLMRRARWLQDHPEAGPAVAVVIALAAVAVVLAREWMTR